ncbi:MAG: phosphoribosylformylglycinamidine synthase II, partial [Acidobacteriota bacterium]|nr:phosphoribosylformylglycinamidine synthase II [Acidobacteriota bacterium]
RAGHRGGTLFGLDLDAQRRIVELVAALVTADYPAVLVDALHDVSSGGLGLCLAEGAAATGVGATVGGVDGHGGLFSESPGRVVLCSSRPEEVLSRAEAAGVPAAVIGTAGGERLAVEGLVDLPVAELVRAWRRALPAALGDAVPA